MNDHIWRGLIALLLFVFLSVAVVNRPEPISLNLDQQCRNNEALLRGGGQTLMLAGDPDGLLAFLLICEKLRLHQ
jgi:hypothetical protein